MPLVTLALIAILSVACSEVSRRSPTAPASTTAVAPAPRPFVPNVAPPFPALKQPARVFETTIEGQSAAFHGGALKARYVLYDDGSFTLQYASARFGHFEYGGTYTESNGQVVFPLSESNPEPWATAIITEESLTVSYSLMAQQADFENGVFLRVRD
jgi:hypothetical protein